MLIRVMIGNAHINFAPKFILEYAEQFPKLRFNMLSPSDVPSFLEGKADVICLSAQAQLSNCISAAERTDDFCAGCDASVS